MSELRSTRIELALLLDERLRRERLRIADKARRNFHTFLKYFAWPVLQPATPFVDNWHIQAVCDHLQAVSENHIKRLIINQPFRTLKSTAVSQAWPAWEWIEHPSLEYLTASYASKLATRDAVSSRRIIESATYRAAWGDRFRMTSDQNVKTHYENSKRGTRVITSTDSAATGFGGNRIIVDDAISALDADSEVARNTSIEWWRGTVATRFNNPAEDAAVVSGQRLHANDLTGWLLENNRHQWEHLVLPMEYETRRIIFLGGKPQEVDTSTIKTSIGFVDPRREEGELLCPQRIDAEALATIKKDLGQYHVDAQLQQRPTPRSGTIFERSNWKFYKVLPELDERIISVDCSFKDLKHSDFVAMQVWGRKGSEKFLIKRIKARMGFGATVTALRSLNAAYPKCIARLVEDKANGSAVIDTLKKEIPGILPIEPEGGKVARAFAVQPEHEAGNLYLPDPSIDPSIEEFISETAAFPNVTNDDETDAFTQAINWYRNRERTTGILDFYDRQIAKQAAARTPQLPPPR